MKLSFLTATALALATSTTTAYSQGSLDALDTLAAHTDTATQNINTLCGCGFTSTSQALTANAPVTDGSACPSADAAITKMLSSLDSELQGALAQLDGSASSAQASPSAAADHFNAFAKSFYGLWNALDLAECTYVLTKASHTHAIAFGSTPSTLQGGFDALVGALNSTAKLQVAAANLKQQTHFAGTESLAAAVAVPASGLLGCATITTIVGAEGMHTSCPA